MSKKKNKRVWIHQQDKKGWRKYFKPKWLNSITHKEGEPKIYRWLWFGYLKKEKA